jgi:deoxycytidylate deaminase
MGAAAFLRNNMNMPRLLEGGYVYSVKYPTRRDIKHLVQMGVRTVYYRLDKDKAKDAVDYYNHLREQGLPFEIVQVDLDGYSHWDCFADYLENEIDYSIKTPFSFADAALLLAKVNGRRSKCIKNQIGCVAFSRRQGLLGAGYNGPVRGDWHCNEVGCIKVHPDPAKQLNCLGEHSEINALNHLSSNVLIVGGILFISHSTCAECAAEIADLGVRAVVFYEPYKRVPNMGNNTVDEFGAVAKIARDHGIAFFQYIDGENGRLKSWV